MLDEDIEKRLGIAATADFQVARFILPVFLPVATLLLIAIIGDGWIRAVSLIMIALVLISSFCFIRGGRRIIESALEAINTAPEGFAYVKSCVEDVCLASGLRPPALRPIEGHGTRAFSFRWGDTRVLYLSPGIADKIGRDELRAVIAHEMAKQEYIYSANDNLEAAIKAAPAALKNRLGRRLGLTVFVLAIILVCLFALGSIPLLLFLATEGGAGVIIYYVLVLFIAVSSLPHVRNVSALNHNSFFLADELALKWTMFPEALIGAMRELESHHDSSSLRFAQKMAFLVTGRDTRPSPLNAYQPRRDTTASLVGHLIGNPFLGLSRFPDVETRLENLGKFVMLPSPSRPGRS